jgi:hypothetical protein
MNHQCNKISSPTFPLTQGWLSIITPMNHQTQCETLFPSRIHPTTWTTNTTKSLTQRSLWLKSVCQLLHQTQCETLCPSRIRPTTWTTNKTKSLTQHSLYLKRLIVIYFTNEPPNPMTNPMYFSTSTTELFCPKLLWAFYTTGLKSASLWIPNGLKRTTLPYPHKTKLPYFSHKLFQSILSCIPMISLIVVVHQWMYCYNHYIIPYPLLPFLPMHSQVFFYPLAS